MDIEYRYRCDDNYFKVVIDRQYRQGPWLLRLPVQFGVAGVVLATFFLASLGISDPKMIILIVMISALAAAIGVWATKQGLMMKFRSREGFCAEAMTLLSEAGVGVGDAERHSVVAWSKYSRAIRFPDGILLKTSRSIRWLPDSAITSGGVADAIALVAAKTSLRSVG